MNHVLKHLEVEGAAYEPARPQHQSADVVKGLLYNIPQRPEDVSNLKGRRQGPLKKATNAPFAQSENIVEADYPSSFHLQKHNKQVNDKVGHGQFDPEVYKANAMANIHNRTQSRARNFVGSGNILSYNK
ncbi:hypothetical protein ABBQ32_009076 [Trebouxia sp. C0010 RCD-2024]